MSERTIAESLVAELHARGVRRIFGVPGGGSSLDVIEAGAALGIEFVLTRTESAAAMMAAATAELTGTLGVALATKGPGTANGVNGVAYASLDRAPMLFLTDGFSAAEQRYVTHQVFDQRAMLAPITKGSADLAGPQPEQELRELLDLALAAPHGPVLIELTSETARKQTAAVARTTAPRNETKPLVPVMVTKLLATARLPVIVLGLEARTPAAAAAGKTFAEALGCPVVATYKAKGVIADRHPQYVGGFTSGAAEAECVGRADLIILIGLDPVELLRQPWRYRAPVVDIALVHHPVHYLQPTVGVYGPLAASLAILQGSARRSDWTLEEIATLRTAMRSALQYRKRGAIGPQEVVELAAAAVETFPVRPRIAVDAGAHMFSAMAFWPCDGPGDVAISNGLASMAFALPAAIALALADRDRPVIAFTGDGGLYMCVGELATAVQHRARVIVIVFNDEALSLIDIKQQQRQLPTRGVRFAQTDFAATMRAMGGRGYRAANVTEYRAALQQALQDSGPALIDVAVDPSGYSDQLKALRG